MLTFTDQQIHAEAVRLGLIAPVEDLPRHLRSQVVASLAAPVADEPEPAGGVPPVEVAPDADAELTVYADGPVLLNGSPFPLPVNGADPIEVIARRGGLTTVRLTVVVGACHLLPGTPDAGTGA